MDVYILCCAFCALFTLTGSHYISYTGCFVNDPDILPFERFDSTYMTNDRCAQHCCTFVEGATHSGTKNAKECHCGRMGSNLLTYIDMNDCNKPCTGNASEICGKNDRFSVSKLYCSAIPRTESKDLSTSGITFVLTKEELDAKIAAITKKIRVDKKQTQSYRRTKVSARDERKSAQYIGFGGILVMVLPIITIILSDILSLFKCKIKNKRGKKSVNGYSVNFN